MLHAHAAIRKERVLLTAKNSPIKYRKKILTLLQAVLESSKVVVIHCKGHQKEESHVSKGNAIADKAAKKSTAQEVLEMALIPQL